MENRRKILMEAIQKKLKLNRLKMIRESIRRQLNEASDPSYPVGADIDSRAPYNQKDVEPKLGYVSGPFKGVAQSADVNILKDMGGNLYVISTDILSQAETDEIYILYIGVPHDDEGDPELNSIDRSSRDINLDAITSYVNQKLKDNMLEIGSGYDDWDSYSKDIIELDQKIKDELIEQHPSLKKFLS